MLPPEKRLQLTGGEAMAQRTTDGRGLNRRAFLIGGTAAGGVAAAAALEALAARAALAPAARSAGASRSQTRAPSPDYGELAPVIDETTGLPLLWLPAGFRYVSFGWTGDRMSDGRPTPARHDGMAALPAEGGRTRLVRNHEVDIGPAAFAPEIAYDQMAGGGTTTVEFDTARGEAKESWASISGTLRNCAGGPTPWGSWLTCEESVAEPGWSNALTKSHGYIFEVPAQVKASAAPLVQMGRFVHEAVAVDPATGIVYETEDDGSDSGFYRFVPNEPGKLEAGGSLQMLGIDGIPRADTRAGQTAGVWRPVVWRTIPAPDPSTIAPATKVFSQGFALGGARFGRLEGAWHGQGRIYFVSTSGGDAGEGQVWEYDPAGDRLKLLFESPGATVLNAPDNLCVSPRGGLVLCEDGIGDQFVHGLTVAGEVFRFARNNVVLEGEKNRLAGNFTESEFAGATYSPDGQWLFFNVQNPGITFAVTGPWGSGAL